MGIEGRNFRRRDAEFIVGAAGGDFRVGAGVDIRVHAQHDSGRHTKAGGKGGEHTELGRAFDINLADFFRQRGAQILGTFADAGENDVFGGDSGLAGAQKLAAADDVGPRPALTQDRQDGQVIIGLDRVMDVRRQAGGGEGAGQGGEPRAQRAGAVDPDRRAVRIGDRIQRHALEAQPVLRMHRQLRAGRQQVSQARRVRRANWMDNHADRSHRPPGRAVAARRGGRSRSGQAR